MPFNDETYALPLGEPWRAFLRGFLNGLDSSLQSLSATVSTHTSKLANLSPVPAGGYPITVLSQAARDGLVLNLGRSGGNFTGTQAQYDALPVEIRSNPAYTFDIVPG